MRYAGPPIERFSFRNSYTGWQIVEDYKIIMLVGDDAYLLTVVPPCPQMRLALFMSIRSSTGATVSRFDRVQLDENNCLIDEIRPIDYRRMRRKTRGNPWRYTSLPAAAAEHERRRGHSGRAGCFQQPSPPSV
jgi:Family of unknown function (DUF6491)